MTKLHIGFIGAGHITELHCLGYRNNPGAQLYAVCDKNEATLQRRVDEWGAAAAYTDYRQLLADKKVDAVEVITPHHLHAEMAIAALEAGKHVSVQKPMCINLTEADAMLTAAKRSGRLFRVFENFRYYPPYVRAKELIDAGEIGEPLSIRIKSIRGNRDFGWNVPPEATEWRLDPTRCGGGSIHFDHGYHIWSLVMWYMGKVDRVHSFIGRSEMRPGWIVDSPSIISWKHAGASKYGSYETAGSNELMVRSKYYASDEWTEITGSRGVIWATRCSGQMLDVPPVTMYRDGVMTHLSNIDTDWATGFINGTHDFLAAIREGRESELTGSEAREVLRFSMAIQLSAQEHREVSLDEITK